MNLIEWITDADSASWGIVCMMFGITQLLDDRCDIPKWFSAILVCLGVVRIALALIVGIVVG